MGGTGYIPLQNLQEDESFPGFIRALKSSSLSCPQVLSTIIELIKHKLPDELVDSVIDILCDPNVPILVKDVDILAIIQSMRLSKQIDELKGRSGVRFRQGPDANKNVDTKTGISSSDRLSQMASLSSQVSDEADIVPTIPIRFHEKLLFALTFRLQQDCPSHLHFFGDKDSFLSAPSVKLYCHTEYTACMWVRIDEASPSKGFLLYRSRSSAGGIDVIMSDRQQDNSWGITLRSYVGNAGTAATLVKGETQGMRITLIPRRWHLLAVRHVNAHAYTASDYAIVSVDGQPVYALDADASDGRINGSRAAEDPRTATAVTELVYPFRSLNQSALDSQWVFALGFRGQVSSISIYNEEISLSMLNFLYALGPFTPHFASGVSVPQTTFESGHLVLGSQFCKGADARRISRLVPQLSITAQSFGTTLNRTYVENAAQMGNGRISTDHVIMTSFTPDPLLSLYLNGKSGISRNYSWIEACISEGGVLLCLYLLWDYCGAVSRRGSTNHMQNNIIDTVSNTGLRIRALLGVIACLIRTSVECKEQFIQLHGFHIVAQCLARQTDDSIRSTYVDAALVDSVVALTTALGTDALQGDGIASALQGLLLDFRVWGGEHITPARAQLIRAINEVLAPSGVVLYNCIGTQRVLDALRLYVFRAARDSALPGTTHERDADTEATANAAQRFLENVLDSALQVANERTAAEARVTQRQPWQLPPPGKREVEMLVSCLEESPSAHLAEKLLLVLWQIRAKMPRSVLHVLHAERFIDTTAVSLLCKQGYSLLVRKRTIGMLQWSLGEELKRLPDELVKLRVYEARTLGQNTFRQNAASVINKRLRSKTFSRSDEQLFDEEAKITSMRRELLLPLLTVWEQLSRLTRCIDLAITDGMWGEYSEAGYDDVLSVLAHDGPLGTVRVWLQLPFLYPLLRAGRANSIQCQRLLMSTNVMLKTDRLQGELLCALPPPLWISTFLELVELGGSAATAATLAGEAVSIDVAQTCVELALDGLGTVLECATRLYCQHSFVAWGVLQQELKSKHGDKEVVYLKRLVSLVLQRLSRSGDAWNADSLSALVNILSIIEKRKLCGNTSFGFPSNSTPVKGATLLDDLSASPELALLPTEFQAQEEKQILSFLIDITSNLRKMSSEYAMKGIEQYVLRPATRIIQSCFRTARGDMSDRVATEALQQLHYMSQYWGAKSADDYKKYFIRMIRTVREAIADPAVQPAERGLYQAHIHSIMQYYSDLRHSAANGSKISPYVLPTLELLTGIDSCNDVDTIFRLIDARVINPDIGMISFINENSADSRTRGASGDDLTMFSDAQSDDNGFPYVSSADFSDASSHPTSPVPLSPSSGAPDFLSDSDPGLDITMDGSPRSGVVPNRGDEETKSRQWLQIRQGIIADRVDTERLRLARSVQAMEVAADAIGKHWERLRYKVESEQFADEHRCEWKLGIAHEGTFPGRKRLVLRPRRLNKHNTGTVLRARHTALPSSTHAVHASVTELGRAMKTFIRSDTETDNSSKASPADADDEVPGAGWGVVGDDGSADGVGVVGIASTDLAPTISDVQPAMKAKSLHDDADLGVVVDVNGDLHEMEVAQAQGRVIETAPAHNGSRRLGSTAALHEIRVILITASGNVNGTLGFNTREIFFTSSNDMDTEENKTDEGTINISRRPIRRRRWLLSSLSALYLRRYRLRDSALEVFFRRGKHRNFFVDFGHKTSDMRARDEFAKKLIKVVPVSEKNPPYLQRPTYLVPNSSLVRQHGVQEEWIAGKLSNFDYLMALNTIAGRTFNDTCQYPVMPWVIAQYTQPTLDLSDPASFRDLSKPMGALNEARLADILDRFDSMEEEYKNSKADIPPFMYGSHYSTMVGVVLHFLVRLQPFASLHCEMQSGHFDVADRLFSSIPRTWRQNTTQLSEVKEITPEWFTTPEMFRNVNGYELGQTQDGVVIGDVEMPPWAKSPEDFVRINREALESDYVSANLHHWIDLIFGYKQTGQAAIDANNVFFYLTYYNAVDRTRIDEELRKQTELQIAHFGQTPMQLFTTPHPAKKVFSASSASSSFLSSLENTSPRLLRQCFAPNAAHVLGVSPSNQAHKCRPELLASMMARPQSVEEGAAASTPATSIALPARIGAPRVPALCVTMLRTRIVCLLTSGVTEVLKFGTSKVAKGSIDTERKAVSRRRRASSRIAPALTQNTETSRNAAWEQAGSAAEDTGMIVFDDDYTPPSTNVPDARDRTEFTSTKSPSYPTQELSTDWANLVLPVALVSLEPDRSNFEVLPRILLPLLPNTTMTALQDAASVVRTTLNGSFFICGGHIDGSIMVRGLDVETGMLSTSGDFRAHRSRVVSIAADRIAEADTDVIASMDDTGHLLIWTVSTLSAPGTRLDKHSIISRRPQRAFHFPLKIVQGVSAENCLPCCDLVWQMGVVIAAAGALVNMYSVERDEIIRAWDVSLTAGDLAPFTAPQPNNQASLISGPNSTLAADLLSFSAELSALNATSDVSMAGNSNMNAKLGTTVVRRIAVSDCGAVILHLAYYPSAALTPQHFLAVHALSGQRVRLLPCLSEVTYLDCPMHGDVTVSGHADGSVFFYESVSLTVLYAFCPPLSSLPQSGTTITAATLTATPEETAVLNVRFGPDQRCPAMACIVTAGGDLYVKSLPDYVHWERVHSPSMYVQVVNAPIKAVRSALQNASTLSTTISENAGVLAHNVKGFADDAIGSVASRGAAGLKTLGEEGSRIVQGFASFFSRKSDK